MGQIHWLNVRDGRLEILELLMGQDGWREQSHCSRGSTRTGRNNWRYNISTQPANERRFELGGVLVVSAGHLGKEEDGSKDACRVCLLVSECE